MQLDSVLAQDLLVMATQDYSSMMGFLNSYGIPIWVLLIVTARVWWRSTDDGRVSARGVFRMEVHIYTALAVMAFGWTPIIAPNMANSSPAQPVPLLVDIALELGLGLNYLIKTTLSVPSTAGHVQGSDAGSSNSPDLVQVATTGQFLQVRDPALRAETMKFYQYCYTPSLAWPNLIAKHPLTLAIQIFPG